MCMELDKGIVHLMGKFGVLVVRETRVLWGEAGECTSLRCLCLSRPRSRDMIRSVDGSAMNTTEIFRRKRSKRVNIRCVIQFDDTLIPEGGTLN